MKATREQILQSVREIEAFSPAPGILASATRLLKDPHSEIGSIAALVGRDAGLAADVIRCSNSAYYGGQSSRTISEAVQKIGMSETLRLLNLAVARIVAGKDLGFYGIQGKNYWAESLFNGLFLQALAKETGEGGDPSEAYTIGLLRFIGRLAINQAAEKVQGGLYWDGYTPIGQWELENVGVQQAEVGGILLGKWRFPEVMVKAVAGQDDPSNLAPGNWLAEAMFFTSELLPQGSGLPFDPAVGPTWSVTPTTSEFMSRHGLSPTGVELILRATSVSFADIRKNFGG